MRLSKLPTVYISFKTKLESISKIENKALGNKVIRFNTNAKKVGIKKKERRDCKTDRKYIAYI